MLTMRVVPVSPQLRIMLLLEPNLIKEVGHSRVRGYGGEEVRASRNSVQKDGRGALSVLNTTPWKKISKIFSPS